MGKVYKNIVVLTGAGISAESGLATFRAANGLWNNHPVEDVATVEAFARNPAYVHDFYNELKPELQKAKPNPAHLALTRLQQEYPAPVSIITQNVDTLHEKAGSKDIYHIHGQINQAVCLNCGQVMENWGDVDTQTICPHCSIQGMMKPNIVFFGENLLYMDKVDRLLAGCDLFVRDDFFAAPDRRFEDGLELIHNSFIVLFARRAGSGRTRMRPPKWRCSRRVSK